MAAANKCNSVAGHVDGHAGALKQYGVHHPIQHVQAYSGSHWTLPSGDCSLHITLAATRATINNTTMQNVLTLLAILMAVAVRWYYTAHIAHWRRSRAFIKATKRRRRVSTRSDSINRTCLLLILGVYFIIKSLKKGSGCPNNNRGMTHQSDEKHLNNMAEYFVGVAKLALYCYNTHFL